MSKRELDQWMSKYDNAMKPVVQRVREILLGADKRLEEVIKWQSPTFIYKGNLASFNPRPKKHASLMFHNGAHIPGKFPHLEGGGETARYITFHQPAGCRGSQEGVGRHRQSMDRDEKIMVNEIA